MKVTILGKPYEVRIQKEADGNGTMGSATRTKQIINIVQGFGKEQREETLLHEIIHVVSEELVMGLEEEDVARLAVGLYSAGIKLPMRV